MAHTSDSTADVHEDVHGKPPCLPPLHGDCSDAEVGGKLSAACAAGARCAAVEASLVLATSEAVPIKLMLMPGLESACAVASPEPPLRLPLASRVRAEQVTTLECLGLSRKAAVEDLVRALHAEGLRGCYNYVSIPRCVEQSTKRFGYAFINFTSVESAALIVDLWEGELGKLQHACFPKTVKFKIASRQGYHQHVRERDIEKFRRIRNTGVWPLIMTEDGQEALFGSSKAMLAASC
mmetsp:Transcript_24780/g.45445  ORF Transcript_24780/g.45445 Transcript_24780/m.45445 type:complete len:237 (+) Transcript_24780:70-780(+)